MSQFDLKAAHKRCTKHRSELMKTATCGCFYCLETFPAVEVEKYTYPDDALCPKCGIDSVLADKSGLPLTREFLTAMYDHWFECEVNVPNT